ncbi:hypothetical protein Celal_3175 [Cellulophaga algicola DSM 14237]|uniref:Uncharacterized protein n=1 Tax=Cellulophaga algicola (strain DSM 14237 / IC166 / ACAM 630) TaxID=688270 RepID=E6X4V7_CELAD|nr:hypothetical protein Celal_3175 [Cellulophaga algicola DSM 14237]
MNTKKEIGIKSLQFFNRVKLASINQRYEDSVVKATETF